MQEAILKHLYTTLPMDVYLADEIEQKAGAIFAHLYSADSGAAVQPLH